VQPGNRDARDWKYSNEIKKDSVPLKEVLTRDCASTSRASCDDAIACVRHAAIDACALDGVTRRQCRKCLCCSTFFDSRSTHSSRGKSARELRDVVNSGVRGLRVAGFGKKNIFMLTSMFVRSLA
jgi:hypothetical protein